MEGGYARLYLLSVLHLLYLDIATDKLVHVCDHDGALDVQDYSVPPNNESAVHQSLMPPQKGSFSRSSSLIHW